MWVVRDSNPRPGDSELTEVRSYALLIKRTTAFNKPGKRSLIEFRVQMTVVVSTLLLLFRT